MIAGSTTESKKELDLGFLVTTIPVKVGVVVGGVVRSGGSAIDYVPESSVL